MDVKILKLPTVFRAQERRQHHASAGKSESSSVEERPWPVHGHHSDFLPRLSCNKSEWKPASTNKKNTLWAAADSTFSTSASESMHEKGLVRSEIWPSVATVMKAKQDWTLGSCQIDMESLHRNNSQLSCKQQRREDIILLPQDAYKGLYYGVWGALKQMLFPWWQYSMRIIHENHRTSSLPSEYKVTYPSGCEELQNQNNSVMLKSLCISYAYKLQNSSLPQGCKVPYAAVWGDCYIRILARRRRRRRIKEPFVVSHECGTQSEGSLTLTESEIAICFSSSKCPSQCNSEYLLLLAGLPLLTLHRQHIPQLRLDLMEDTAKSERLKRTKKLKLSMIDNTIPLSLSLSLSLSLRLLPLHTEKL